MNTQQPPAEGATEVPSQNLPQLFSLKDEVFPTSSKRSTLSVSPSSSSRLDETRKERRYSTGTIFAISQRPLPIWNTVNATPARHPLPTLPAFPTVPAVPTASAKPHACPHAPCTLRFATRGRLNKHVKSHTQEYTCTYAGCDRRFGRSDGRDLHVLSEHDGVRWECQFCGKKFRHPCSRGHHERVVCGKKGGAVESGDDVDVDVEMKEADGKEDDAHMEANGVTGKENDVDRVDDGMREDNVEMKEGEVYGEEEEIDAKEDAVSEL